MGSQDTGWAGSEWEKVIGRVSELSHARAPVLGLSLGMGKSVGVAFGIKDGGCTEVKLGGTRQGK